MSSGSSIQSASEVPTCAHWVLVRSSCVSGLRERPVSSHGPMSPKTGRNSRAGLDALVAESRAAGMRITARIELGDAELPAAMGRTAYRIVQEGLTNARKHAPGAAVTLEVDASEGELRVEVRSLAPVAVASVPLPGAGTGLIGLAERVTLARGELEHGVDADGAFVLRARLPR